MKSSAQDYEQRGPRYQAAWRVLESGCEVPPSVEVFEHQLELARTETPGLGVEGMARRLAESYHRVQGFFESENGQTRHVVRVDVEDNIAHVDKVDKWRRDELKRMFPEMREEEVDHLVASPIPYMLEQAKKLADDGCPASYAYRILRS